MNTNVSNWERFFAELGAHRPAEPPSPQCLGISPDCPPLSRFAIADHWTAEELAHLEQCQRCARLKDLAHRQCESTLTEERLVAVIRDLLLELDPTPEMPIGSLVDSLAERTYGDRFADRPLDEQLTFYWAAGLELLPKGSSEGATVRPGDTVGPRRKQSAVTGQKFDDLDRKVFVLSEGAGRSPEEIARLLGVSADDVSCRVRRISLELGW